jgi:replicative DNA helicase
MPVRAAVREQQKRERGPERALLMGLLHAPEDLDVTRQRLSPEDFLDPGCRALALWIWSGSPGLPELEPAASLARELLTSGIEHFDWRAEVAGATRKLVERRLRQQLKDRRNQLGRVEHETEAARLMQEIDDIARSLRELGT